MGRGKTWTHEEDEILRELWGNSSFQTITKKLGRSESSVYQRVRRLKLGKFLESNDHGKISFNALMKALGVSVGSTYKKVAWSVKRGLPLHRQKRRKKSYLMVRIPEFWIWAEKNQSFLDFSKFQKFALGPEPEWVEVKRQRDILKAAQWTNNCTRWTKHEEEYLLSLLKQYKYTYVDLTKIFRRTTGAIQKKITDMGWMERPLSVSNHEKWSAEQLQLLEDMIRNGNNYQEMQEAIGKSEKAIRGRVYILYKTERLDAVREKLRYA